MLSRQLLRSATRRVSCVLLAALQEKVVAEKSVDNQNKPVIDINYHLQVMTDRERVLDERQQQF